MGLIMPIFQGCLKIKCDHVFSRVSVIQLVLNICLFTSLSVFPVNPIVILSWCICKRRK